jgi:hypothetical protein
MHLFFVHYPHPGHFFWWGVDCQGMGNLPRAHHPAKVRVHNAAPAHLARGETQVSLTPGGARTQQLWRATWLVRRTQAKLRHDQWLGCLTSIAEMVGLDHWPVHICIHIVYYYVLWKTAHRSGFRVRSDRQPTQRDNCKIKPYPNWHETKPQRPQYCV